MDIKAWFIFPVAPIGGSDIDPATSLPYDRLERDLTAGEGVILHTSEITLRADDGATLTTSIGPHRSIFRIWFTEPMSGPYAVLASEILGGGSSPFVYHKTAQYIDLVVDLIGYTNDPYEINVAVVA